jgi:hypothetical protein
MWATVYMPTAGLLRVESRPHSLEGFLNLYFYRNVKVGGGGVSFRWLSKCGFQTIQHFEALPFTFSTCCAIIFVSVGLLAAGSQGPG